MATAGVTFGERNEGIIGPSVEYIGSVAGGDIVGGLSLIGFVDVEKLMNFTSPRGARTLFLEKKLPFQIVLLDFDPADPNVTNLTAEESNSMESDVL